MAAPCSGPPVHFSESGMRFGSVGLSLLAWKPAGSDTLSVMVAGAPRFTFTVGCGAIFICGAICANSAVAAVNRKTLKQFLNRIVKLFLIDQTNVYRRNAAIAINHKRGGQSFHAAIHIACFLIAQHDPVVDLLLGHEGLDVFPAVVIHGNAENCEAAIFVFPLEVREPGDFDPTGPT